MKSSPRLLLLAPSLLLIIIFMILPMSIMLVYSFLEAGAYGGVEWNFTPSAYVQFLFEEDLFSEELIFTSDYLAIFLRSIFQAIIATLLCFIIGFPTAYFIATRPAGQKMYWLFLITIPYWVNLLVRTIALLFVLRDDGPINNFFMTLGITDSPMPLAFSNFAIGLGLVYSYLPFMILPIYSAMERFDLRLLEAAYDLYSGYRAAFLKVLLPLVKPGVIAGCLLVFIPSVGSFLAPDILGGGKQLMIGNLIAMQFQGARNWPFGSAVAMILLSITLIILLIFSHRAGKALSDSH